eukprot:TRINITY_DN8660_c0_g1_i1.p1 TRINITY_DN8660_c0_g1~~TRINITY_DN8660_c0_g1_i1.p1  ORF type:complete len:177 (-),score=4.81 TRINITY_DN8660_c0_g1_i1:72-602(-)
MKMLQDLTGCSSLGRPAPTVAGETVGRRVACDGNSSRCTCWVRPRSKEGKNHHITDELGMSCRFSVLQLAESVLQQLARLRADLRDALQQIGQLRVVACNFGDGQKKGAILDRQGTLGIVEQAHHVHIKSARPVSRGGPMMRSSLHGSSSANELNCRVGSVQRENRSSHLHGRAHG